MAKTTHACNRSTPQFSREVCVFHSITNIRLWINLWPYWTITPRHQRLTHRVRSRIVVVFDLPNNVATTVKEVVHVRVGSFEADASLPMYQVLEQPQHPKVLSGSGYQGHRFFPPEHQFNAMTLHEPHWSWLPLHLTVRTMHVLYCTAN